MVAQCNVMIYNGEVNATERRRKAKKEKLYPDDSPYADLSAVVRRSFVSSVSKDLPSVSGVAGSGMSTDFWKQRVDQPLLHHHSGHPDVKCSL